MFDFCPHCGETIGGQDQIAGRMLVCRFCKKDIGIVPAPVAQRAVDPTEERLRAGTAARCPVCAQAVEIKITGNTRSLVPHFTVGEKRRICPGSGKPATATKIEDRGSKIENRESKIEDRATPRKDLSAHYHRDVIRVAACRRDAEPTIEELKLDYLDPADRVRLQIDALRDLLGKSFQMKPYPPDLHRPDLALWTNADVCVIAKKHPHGGYAPMSQDELLQVVADLRRDKGRFFA